MGFALGVAGMMFYITHADNLNFNPILNRTTDGLAGFLLLGCGAFAHARRPDNQIGLLMVLLGVARFAEDIQLSVTPWVKLVGLPLTMAAVGSTVHLVLAFPSGEPARFDLGLLIVKMVRVGLAVAVFSVLLNRWRTATPPVRRLLTPMFVVVILGGAVELVVNAWPASQATAAGIAANLVGRGAHSLFPVLFLVGVLQVRMGRTVVAEMLTRLGGRDVAVLVHDAAVSENRHVLEATVATVGLALEHERLTTEARTRQAEIRATRARISEVADAERHRIERDLHDGAQQRLVTAAPTFQMASERLASDADPELAALLKIGVDDLNTALRELRELAREIHPAVLTEAGLVAALEALAERAPLPVTIIADPLPPLPSIIEATAYFVAAEALTNALKHAGARHVWITVHHTDTDLRVEIDDDGVCGAEMVTGGGLAGLADRVAAADGELVLGSPPGAGTHLVACLPTRMSETSTPSGMKTVNQ